MNIGKILKRAWSILWNYRALWVFGLILTLTVGSGVTPRGNASSSGNNNSNGSSLPMNGPFFTNLEKFGDWVQKELPVKPIESFLQNESLIIGIAVALVAAAIIMAMIMTFARFVAETAVIRMVDEYETTGVQVSVRRGFRLGWSRAAWRLFLINLLTDLPIIMIVLLLIGLGLGVYFLSQGNNGIVSSFTTLSGIGLAFIFVFILVILSVILTFLRQFFWRASALENVGVFEGIRQGFDMVKRNWKESGLMWLVMIGLGIGWTIVRVVVMFFLIPFFFLTIMAGIIVGGIPVLLVAGISSLFLSGFWPWVIGALFGLPLFILVAGAPAIFVNALVQVFKSTVWTLTYRELKVIGTLQPLELPAQPA